MAATKRGRNSALSATSSDSVKSPKSNGKAKVKKEIDPNPSPNKRQRSTRSTRSSKDVKLEEEEEEKKPRVASTSASPTKKSNSEKKLSEYKASTKAGPFPNHLSPTPEEAERVAWVLGEFHGYKREDQGGTGLPKFTPPKQDAAWGGCGNVSDILDATIRTVLSCNTSGRNSTAAHKSLTERFGRNNWKGILEAPESELVDAIRCGGLANNKAKTIRGILTSTLEKFGVLSLDHLHNSTEDEIMEVMLSFNGVGPKVASCVLAFCMGREQLAVDTHVFRLAKALNFVPEKATRDQTYYHLNERVPGPLRYPLHVLLIKHGKRCPNCSARGFATVKDDIQSESDDEEDSKEEKKIRPCPLKANGLLGKKGNGKKLKKEDEDVKEGIKVENGAMEETKPEVETEIKEEVKEEIKKEES